MHFAHCCIFVGSLDSIIIAFIHIVFPLALTFLCTVFLGPRQEALIESWYIYTILCRLLYDYLIYLISLTSIFRLTYHLIFLCQHASCQITFLRNFRFSLSCFRVVLTNFLIRLFAADKIIKSIQISVTITFPLPITNFLYLSRFRIPLTNV